MSTPITTREDLTRIQWFAMSAIKNEKKGGRDAQRQGWSRVFHTETPAVRVYHGVKSKRLCKVIRISSSCMLPETDHGFQKKYNFLQFMMWEKARD